MANATPRYDTSAPVLVTGATGYVAGWLVRHLLDEGFTVHAAVRDPSNAGKIAHLEEMAANAPGSIVFFKADLLDDGSYAEAMAGCRTVFHTASPFLASYDDPQTDLVDPALKGTRNVLGTVDATDSVERVVLTSSVAAIYGDNSDMEKAPGGVLTEEVWNTSSSLDDNPYSYSKTVAERAAWEIAEAQDRWRMVVVNPALVVGPGTADSQTSASFDYVGMLLDGTFEDGAPTFELGLVDVRDVAEAHLRAAFLPDARGRHIVYAEVMDLSGVADVLRPEAGSDWPLPAPAPDREVTPWRADNSRSREDLGLDYRPVPAALIAMFRKMVETGAVKKP